ncbi:MAG: endonuclease/exonuclease/phosphatase family protein [Candidatus Binatia bacterium]
MEDVNTIVRPLTVASYNIHQCVGLDGRYDPVRIAQVIREIDADIIGLQEVHSRVSENPEAHQLEFLASTTGMHAVAGPTLYRRGGHYGNAMLTNASVHGVRFVDLSVADYEPRGGIDAQVVIAGGKLRVLVTHLGLGAAERRAQVTRLLSLLMEERCGMVVLLGDINEWMPGAYSLQWLENFFGCAPAPRTFPSRFPLFALDRIWAKPAEILSRVHVHSSPQSRIASDHLPVVATLQTT